MRLAGRRPGLTLFIDSFFQDVLLGLETSANGTTLITFRLYDGDGRLVVDSPEPLPFPQGLSVHSPAGELLLQIPSDPSDVLEYCLYNRQGDLLTVSDGKRTQIFKGLRMADKNDPPATHTTIVPPPAPPPVPPPPPAPPAPPVLS